MSESEARLRAASDQLSAALRDLAPALAIYREALRECGFSEAQAMELLLRCQSDLLRDA